MKSKYFLLFCLLFLIFTSCSTEKQCTQTINKYISYSKEGQFDRIYNNLLTGPALDSFSYFVADMAQDKSSEKFNEIVNTYRKIKKIRIIQIEPYENDEVAIKFQLIRKDGVVEDTPWWRFKREDNKMKIMKFSKH